MTNQVSTPSPTDHELPDSLGLMSARDRLLFALEGIDQDDVAARLARVVESVSDRLKNAFDEDARQLERVTETARVKADRAWQALAHNGIAEIEQAGAMIPGLSHQELYIRDLKAACTRAETIDGFRAEIDALVSKWGSVLKYPLFGTARKKELKGLARRVESSFPAAREKAEEDVRSSIATLRQQVHDQSQEKIRSVILDFGGLLSSGFEVDLAAEEMIRMRWVLISILTKRLFTWLMDAIRNEDSRTQDSVYFAIECLLGQIYESFKVFIVAYKRRASEIDALDTVGSIINLEIRSAQQVTAQFEQQIRAQPLNPVLSTRIKDLLRAQPLGTGDGKEALVAAVSGLRGTPRFGEFLSHLKRAPGVGEEAADRVAVAIKTTIEPFRSLTYVAITLVRYLKGLENFKPA